MTILIYFGKTNNNNKKVGAYVRKGRVSKELGSKREDFVVWSTTWTTLEGVLQVFSAQLAQPSVQVVLAGPNHRRPFRERERALDLSPLMEDLTDPKTLPTAISAPYLHIPRFLSTSFSYSFPIRLSKL